MAASHSSRASRDRRWSDRLLALGSLSFLMVGLLACTGLPDRQATGPSSQDVIFDTSSPTSSPGSMTQPPSTPTIRILGQRLPITAKAKIGSDVIRL